MIVVVATWSIARTFGSSLGLLAIATLLAIPVVYYLLAVVARFLRRCSSSGRPSELVARRFDDGQAVPSEASRHRFVPRRWSTECMAVAVLAVIATDFGSVFVKLSGSVIALAALTLAFLPARSHYAYVRWGEGVAFIPGIETIDGEWITQLDANNALLEVRRPFAVGFSKGRQSTFRMDCFLRPERFHSALVRRSRSQKSSPPNPHS